MYTESAVCSLPRTFPSSLLSDFVAGLSDELLLCPARALSEYVARTSRVVNRPRVPLCGLVVLVLFRKIVSFSCC